MAKKTQEEDAKMDMTPMIDCVFQLIVFFFLIIDLQNQELENLKLPPSEYAVPDEPPEGFRPIINIQQNGTMIHRTVVYHDPVKDKDDFSGLKRLFKQWLDSKLMKKVMDPDLKIMLPDDPLLIRADEWTEMHHIAKVMETCGDQDIMIWRVELALGEKKDDKKSGGAGGSKQE